MERNNYGINHSESEVLLPPRKRLLAGFKKQNADANGSASSPSKPEASSSTSSASSDVQTHLNSLLVSVPRSPNLTPEEVAESSRLAAVAAAKLAKAARAVADEKAAVAAEAVAAARRALNLVSAFSGEEAAAKETSPKKNHKLKKKQVPIETVYTKEGQREDDEADVELAFRLHRAINSSPRSLGNCSDSTPKRLKLYKKQKTLDTSGNSRLSIEHENALEATSGSSEYKTGDEIDSPGRKRRRVKVKMLPLRSCDSKNEEEEEDDDDTTVTKSSSKLSTALIQKKTLCDPEGLGKDFPAETWSCQGLKTPECIKQAVGS